MSDSKDSPVYSDTGKYRLIEVKKGKRAGNKYWQLVKGATVDGQKDCPPEYVYVPERKNKKGKTIKAHCSKQKPAVAVGDKKQKRKKVDINLRNLKKTACHKLGGTYVKARQITDKNGRKRTLKAHCKGAVSPAMMTKDMRKKLANKRFRALDEKECVNKGGVYVKARQITDKKGNTKTLKAYCSKQKPAVAVGDKKQKRKKVDINLRNLKKTACHKLGGTYVKARQITDKNGRKRTLKAHCKGAVSPAMMTKDMRKKLANKRFRALDEKECVNKGGVYVKARQITDKKGNTKTLKAYCSKQKPAVAVGDKKQKRKKVDINLRNLKKTACHKLGGTYVKARQITDKNGRKRTLKAHCKGAVSPAMMTKDMRKKLANKRFRALDEKECVNKGGVYVKARQITDKKGNTKTLKAYCSKQKPAVAVGDKKQKRKKVDINLRNLKKTACHKLGGTYVKARQITDKNGRKRTLKAHCKGAVSPAMMTKDMRKKLANKRFRALDEKECVNKGGVYVKARQITDKKGKTKTLKAYCSKQKPAAVPAIVLDIDDSSVLAALVGNKIKKVSADSKLEENQKKVAKFASDPSRMAPPYHAWAYQGKQKAGRKRSNGKKPRYVSTQREDGVWTWVPVAKKK